MDKPDGRTSHDVVNRVRRALGTRRVGHAGTLDPFATGLLLVLVGAATRLAQFLTTLSKTYTGRIHLGVSTDSLDPTGQVTSTSEAWRSVSDSDILNAMRDLTGNIQQVPPVLSAKKVEGLTAHRRTRRGERLDLPPVPVTVERFDMRGRDGAQVLFEASVGSGTYIRSLARDLGAVLGCGAHLAELRRTSIGSFTVEAALAMDSDLTAGLQAPGLCVPHLARTDISASQAKALGFGQSVEFADENGSSRLVAVYCGAHLIAIADADAGQLRPRVVLVT